MSQFFFLTQCLGEGRWVVHPGPPLEHSCRPKAPPPPPGLTINISQAPSTGRLTRSTQWPSQMKGGWSGWHTMCPAGLENCGEGRCWRRPVERQNGVGKYSSWTRELTLISVTRLRTQTPQDSLMKILANM